MTKAVKPVCGACASASKNLKVLVIGGDHENTLASVRALGLDGIAFDLMIHGGLLGRRAVVAASKYAPEPLYCEGTYDAVRGAIEAWMGESDPSGCALLPSSDLAALVVDERFRPLGAKVSGFAGDRWHICDLMDKLTQAQWAEARGIPVAKGAEIDSTALGTKSPVEFPVIVKPAVSAEGRKSDIRICHDGGEYAEAVGLFADAGYKRALVQELVDYEYEITCVGAIRLDGTSVWRAYAKEIVYPEGRGSIACGHLETDPSVLKVIDGVLQTMAREGYRGLCDIEFFRTSDRVILNEINFRQSGIAAFTFCEGLFLPSLWARELLGHPKAVAPDYPSEPYRVVYESGYFRYTRETGEGVREWLRALGERGGKNLLFEKDNGPFRTFVRNTLANKARRLAGKLRRTERP